MLAWLLFFFIAFGAKVVLACAMIYLILPADRVCSGCDAETLPLRMGALGRTFSGLMLGRVQRRFCPRCGWEGFVRTRGRGVPGALPADVGRTAATRR
ncbi:MAG TPA: hypothetical protein VEW03_04840 [Longimicrobiaceae bacterium]|nr:hypothetical protein [Longimicrobiaceae bacterium]